MLQTFVAICMALQVATAPLHIMPATSSESTVQHTQQATTSSTTFSRDWSITFTGHGKYAPDRRDYVPCTFTVLNKGQRVNDVTIELYRPLANKQQQSMAMVAGTATADVMKQGETITLSNYPIPTNVERVEFVITWKLDGRKYMQSLFFAPAELW